MHISQYIEFTNVAIYVLYIIHLTCMYLLFTSVIVTWQTTWVLSAKGITPLIFLRRHLLEPLFFLYIITYQIQLPTKKPNLQKEVNNNIKNHFENLTLVSRSESHRKRRRHMKLSLFSHQLGDVKGSKKYWYEILLRGLSAEIWPKTEKLPKVIGKKHIVNELITAKLWQTERRELMCPCHYESLNVKKYNEYKSQSSFHLIKNTINICKYYTK